MGDEPNGERQRWWVRLRRSYGLPDLVTDANARAVIVNRLMSEHPMQLVQLGQDLEIASDLLNSFLEVCTTGAMDGVLLSNGDSQSIASEGNPRSAILLKPLSDRGVVSGPSVAAAGAMVDQLVSMIKASVDRMPFEARVDGYFAL